MVVENAAGNRIRLHKVTELTSAEQSAMSALSANLVPLYARLGWQSFGGDVLVTQWGERSKFTYNLSMTHPVSALGPTGGVIDLMGPPW